MPEFTPLIATHKNLRKLQKSGPFFYAYKWVMDGYRPPFYDKIHNNDYRPGTTHKIKDINTDTAQGCGSGLHVCTLDWGWHTYWRLMLVRIDADAAVVIPCNTDGKFRVNKFYVVEELSPRIIRGERGALPTGRKSVLKRDGTPKPVSYEAPKVYGLTSTIVRGAKRVARKRRVARRRRR